MDIELKCPECGEDVKEWVNHNKCRGCKTIFKKKFPVSATAEKSEFNTLLTDKEKELLKKMMGFYARQEMTRYRDYQEEDLYYSIQKKLLENG